MKRQESDLQIQCVNYFKMWHPSLLIHHSPNGGRRNPVEGARFKRMGVLAGFPDLIIIGPQKIIFIELKADKGRLSDSQKEMHVRLDALGHKVFTVNSLDDFIGVIKKEYS